MHHNTGIAPFATLIVRIANERGRQEYFDPKEFEKLKESLRQYECTNKENAAVKPNNEAEERKHKPKNTQPEPKAEIPRIKCNGFPKFAQKTDSPHEEHNAQWNNRKYQYMPTLRAHDSHLKYYGAHIAFSDGSHHKTKKDGEDGPDADDDELAANDEVSEGGQHDRKPYRCCRGLCGFRYGRRRGTFSA